MVNWDAIEHFIGYGDIAAPIVFIGLEEGLFSDEALVSDLRSRSQFAPVMDVEVAHRNLVGGRELFSDHTRAQPTWRVMADVMLHFEGKLPASKEQRSLARKQYRTTRLGRADGNSLLVELLPYPHRKTSTWLYTDRFETRDTYMQHMLEMRLALLRDVLSQKKRIAIVCYGRSAWPQFKLLFPDAQWQSAAHFEITDVDGARVCLTPHFSSRAFNTDTQLDALSEIALRNQQVLGSATKVPK